jgi:methylenetetrahydrofolate dehydrogenase (NADP+)/methenyltetrahydrofolate cyclohydrolase
LIKSTGVALAGRKAVVVGRSNLVGKPAALLLLNEHCTVTICHSRTKDLAAEVRQADILIAAAGKAGLITGEMIKPGAIVIDVGTNRVDGKLVGDVDFAEAEKKAGYLTPVPGGVGPMTRAILMKNTWTAFQLSRS